MPSTCMSYRMYGACHTSHVTCHIWCHMHVTCLVHVTCHIPMCLVHVACHMISHVCTYIRNLSHTHYLSQSFNFSSQRCIEMLNSLPELSRSGHLLHCKATLLLSHTSSVQGTTSEGGAGKDMLKVYDGLIENIRKQVGHVLKYTPEEPLSLSCLTDV